MTEHHGQMSSKTSAEGVAGNATKRSVGESAPGSVADTATGTATDTATDTVTRDAAVIEAAGDEAAASPTPGDGPPTLEEVDDKAAPRSSLNLMQVISSVLAAGLGVQSSRNRERDFEQGRAGTFIVAGLIFTALFIGGVYTVVSLVLSGR